MIANRAEFISRFLYQIRDDEFYGNPGSLPKPEIIEQAASAAKDVLGFDAHRAAFTTLAEVIDICTSEELDLRGSGIAARNATKHPKVIALKKTDSQQRAAIAAAAAQGLAWMEDCRPWVADTTLRNQIAKRVMTAILYSIGRIKRGYTAAQLSALTQIGTSLQDMDIFVVRARDTIYEIVGNKTAT
jgi:hypothetical protein